MPVTESYSHYRRKDRPETSKSDDFENYRREKSPFKDMRRPTREAEFKTAETSHSYKGREQSDLENYRQEKSPLKETRRSTHEAEYRSVETSYGHKDRPQTSKSEDFLEQRRHKDKAQTSKGADLLEQLKQDRGGQMKQTRRPTHETEYKLVESEDKVCHSFIYLFSAFTDLSNI